MAATAASGAADMSAADMSAADLRQLWSLACMFAQQQLTTQTAQCLEALCAMDESTRTVEDQEILLEAEVLLAETHMVACSGAEKAEDRELWQRRVVRAEKCIYNADRAIQRGVACNREWKLRLFKAKFLLQQHSKIERAVKNRRLLELLCQAIQCCAEAADNSDENLVAMFRKYFELKLKACLVKMHASMVMAKNAQASSAANSFANNLKYLRSAVPNYVDKSFLLWLVEVASHTAISSFHPDSTTEMRKVVNFGQNFFSKIIEEQPVSPDFHVYHLIITGFYHLRTGKAAKIPPLLDEIKELIQGEKGEGDQKIGGMLKEAYLDTILDALRVNVMACSEPTQALTLAMGTIHAAQTNLKSYASHPAVRLMLIATLFDMLYQYCWLLGLQCRYADMGASIVQMTTLFVKHKSHLERTIFYRFFLARCHTLIAKYATAIGNVKDACAHLNFVVNTVLPAPSDGDAPYPDAYLIIWVEVLEVATYCCGFTTMQGTITKDRAPNTGVEVKQIYPSRVLLEWVTRILEMDALRRHIYGCCSVELRVKYDLALAKWLWATTHVPLVGSSGERASVAQRRFCTQHADLEALRPKLFSLLKESLQRMKTGVDCSETMSEIMALFGPQLVAYGKVSHGEDTLTNALRTSLHSKNVLLQARLLVDIFELYSSKQLRDAQQTATAKYEKKLAILQRRVEAARSEDSTVVALMRWTAGAGSNGGEAKTPTSARG